MFLKLVEIVDAENQQQNSAIEDSKVLIQKIVDCPQCKGDSVYHISNASRPFCSIRCRSIDLGAWANESFRLAENEPKDVNSPDLFNDLQQRDL